MLGWLVAHSCMKRTTARALFCFLTATSIAPEHVAVAVENAPAGAPNQPAKLYGVVRLSGTYTNRDVLFWAPETKPISGLLMSGRQPDRIQCDYTLSRESPDPNLPYEYTGIIAADDRSDKSSRRLEAAIADLRKQIEEENRAAVERNQWIHAALVEAIGIENLPDELASNGPTFDVQPRVWWDWWRKQRNDNRYFAEGTEVWTETCPKIIEDITAGDRVLTQDLKTDEFGMNLVIGIDVKPQDAMRVVETNFRMIVTTPDQPFFVVDKGWCNADDLAPGMELKGLADSHRFEKSFTWNGNLFV